MISSGFGQEALLSHYIGPVLPELLEPQRS